MAKKIKGISAWSKTKCSNCGKNVQQNFDYCPWCGEKFDYKVVRDNVRFNTY